MTRSVAKWTLKLGCAAGLVVAALAIFGTPAMLDVGEKDQSAGPIILTMGHVAMIAALAAAVIGLFRPAWALIVSIVALIAAVPLILALSYPRLWCAMDCPPAADMFPTQSGGVLIPSLLVPPILGFFWLRRA